VGKVAERGFQAAYDDRDFFLKNGVSRNGVPGSPDAGDLGNKGAIRTEAGAASGGIGVLRTRFAGGSITGDHGIHVTGTNEKSQAGTPQDPERIGVLPVRLRDNPDAVTFGFQDTADEGGRKRRVIYIGVT
jgi:hypothetical protein